MSKSSAPYLHPLLERLLGRLGEPRRFVQVVLGPRQVGKTTLARQALERLDEPAHYASADGPLLEDRVWIEQQWEVARLRSKILVLDEIQKIPSWSEVVKRLWDEDTRSGAPLKVVLLGSSPLLMERGLGESLAGRFEILRMSHWSFPEMRAAFGLNLEQFFWFGGYPGAAALIDDPERFRQYIFDALIEPVLSRDILLRTRVDKPALLRRLFQLGCDYSGQILSFQKMLGELLDAGNTTTLAHYLELLSGAGLLTGLQKVTKKPLRQRTSSPKLLVLNTALMSTVSRRSFEEARSDPIFWGHLAETAAGAHLVNATRGSDIEVFYWRERSQEVDFVLRRGDRLVALEIKSGRTKKVEGLEAFDRLFEPERKLLVGTAGIGFEDFLSTPPTEWFGK